MKILQVNSVYKKGSTGKIMYDVHKELLAQGVDSIVCYGRGEEYNEKNVYKICGELYSKINHFWANLSGIMYGGCFFSTRKLKKIILKEKPDVVHLQCINGYFINIYKIIEWLKKNNIKTVLTLHAEFIYTANCGHSLDCEKWKKGCGNCPRLKKEIGSYFFDRTAKSWKNMKNSFEGFNDNLIVTSVSPWLMGRAKESLILGDKNHKVVLNGLDTGIFKNYISEDLKKKYVSKEKIIFHATPNFNDDKNHLKGGYYLIELAKTLEGKNIKFLIAGRSKENIKLPSNIILLGEIKNQVELAKYYSMADLTLLTSKKETFSMVTAESLCCGTPVVGFKAGAPEQIALENYSSFVDYGNIEELKGTVLEFIDKNFDKKEISKEAIQKYSKDVMCKNYIEVYKKLINMEKK